MTTVPGLSVRPAPRVGAPRGPEQRLLSEVLSVVRQHLGMEVAFVSRVAGGRRTFEFVDTVEDFAPIAVGDSDALEDSYCGGVLSGAVPGLVVDAQREPSVAGLEATWNLPIGTHLAVPVYSGTSVYGTLCCFSRTVVPGTTPAELATLRMFADIVGKHLQPLADRARAAAAQQQRLGQLLDEGGPRIALQPIVELATDRVWGFEALARFPQGEWTAPQEWFAAAERVGLGAALESAAIHNALTLLPRLPEGLVLSVNVSAAALVASASIPAMFTGPVAERLVLEITEHERIGDPRRLGARLALARAAGVRVAVDDAGSGFAGLERILVLAPEVVKLDRALVTGIPGDSARQALCEAMVRFCDRTGSALVAEGVETREELETVRALGVPYAQGYFLGRPELWS